MFKLSRGVQVYQPQQISETKGDPSTLKISLFEFTLP